MASDTDGDEVVVSFEGDEDDDMANLFSFGLDGDDQGKSQEEEPDYSMVMASVMPRHRSDSDDSFLAMLDGAAAGGGAGASASDDDMLLLGDEDLGGGAAANGADGKPEKPPSNDKEAQEMLEWLDQDDAGPNANDTSAIAEDSERDTSQDDLEFTAESDVKHLPKPSISFDTVEDALASPKATVAHFRDLLQSSETPLPSKIRPQLWSRVIAPDIASIEDSDAAKAFREWESSSQPSDLPSDDVVELLVARISTVTGGSKEFCQKALVSVLGYYQYSTGDKRTKATPDKPETEAKGVDTKDEVATADQSEDTKEAAQADDAPEAKTAQQDSDFDPVIPPIVCTLLSSGMSKATAAALLKPLLSTFMPFVSRIPHSDRAQASRAIHRHFYLLSCYHLPLLVYHLDRHVPNWFEAVAVEDEEHHGKVPLSWFASLMAGECTTSKDSEGKMTRSVTMIDPKHLLFLWDFILTSEHRVSVRYFLVLAQLEAHSGELLLLNGDELAAQLARVLQCHQGKDEVTDEGFSIEDSNAASATQAADYVQKWIDDAQTIWEATPTSVLDTLAGLELHVVKQAILARQRREAAEAQRRAEAAAQAQQAAAQSEHEKKQEAARLRLTRARLVAFYRTYNPGKEDNIDKIMVNYEGRYEILDAKLRKKYGVGFNPAIKPKTQPQPQPQPATKADASSNQGGFGSRFFGTRRKEEEPLANLKREKMVASVSVSEILPIICWSKKGAAHKALRGTNRPRLQTKGKAALPPRYYLVDSRPEATVLEQGGFPTAVSLSPEMMLDADKLSAQEAVFESLRGIVHICVMGEGFGALPALYGHKMTRGLHEHIKEDESRTLLCALYFVKKGYPFVSIFEGGFASAHAWLWRKGAAHQLHANNVLTNFDPESSMFSQFEKLHRDQQEAANPNAQDKKQRVIQNLFESRVTKLSNDVPPQGDKSASQQNNMRNMVVGRFFNTGSGTNSTSPQKTAPESEDAPAGEAAASDESKATSAPQNFFGNMIKQRLNQSQNQSQETKREESTDSLVIESVDDLESSEEMALPSEAKKEVDAATIKRQQPNNTFTNETQSKQKDEKNGSGAEETQPESPPASNPSVQNLGNRFAGLGAALKNTTTNIAAAPARNPFARFSRNGPAQAPAPAVPAGFGGLNMLRLGRNNQRGADEAAAPQAPPSALMSEVEGDTEIVEDMDQPVVTKV